MKLRDYQNTLVDNITSKMAKGHTKILCVAPMRSGKTVVFSYIAQRASKKGNRVLIITERKRLFGQTQNELRNFGIEPFMIGAGTKKINDSQVYVAMPLSLKTRTKALPKIDIVIYDECHRTIADWIFSHFKDSFILGFTGSPARSGKQTQLGDLYSTIAMGPRTVDLEKMGHVLPLKIWKVDAPDLSDVQVKQTANGKEFDNQQMYQKFDSPKVYQGVVDNWLKFREDTITLIYCCNIIHAVKTCIAFNERGIKCFFLSSSVAKPRLKENPSEGDKTKYKLKLEDYNLWSSSQDLTGPESEVLSNWGKTFKVLVNVDVFTFGANFPELETVVANRATLSLPLWIQLANRACTPLKNKKEPALLDFGSNVDRLQEPNYPHEWSLFHDYKETKGGLEGYKDCPKCMAMIRVSDRVCDFCGFAFPKSKEEKLVELVEHKYNNMPLSNINTKEMSFEELEAFVKLRGYKMGWLFRQLTFDGRLEDYAKFKGHASKWVYVTKKIYEKGS